MQECFCRSKGEDFMGWFVQLIAPVLTGVKPAEILSFPNDEKHSSRLETIKTRLKQNSKLKLQELNFCNKCTKLLIYNPDVLNHTLMDKRSILFLTKLGYPKEYSLEAYVETLFSKMKDGDIPDEIGIFLGYPLKDVMGFIGHTSLKLTKVKGWRVYGDPRLSDMKYNAFVEAKETIRKLLAYNSPDWILEAV